MKGKKKSLHCSKNFKNITGYLHGAAILAIAIFSGIQIYELQDKKEVTFWIPLGLCIMMLLRTPNIVCVALDDPHGWYFFTGTMVALLTNAYITYLIIKNQKKKKEKIDS